MNNTTLRDIQQALNAIRGELERVDDETKWAALKSMLGTSASVLALAKRMEKPETKTVTRTVAVPKTKIIKQPSPQKSVANNVSPTDTSPQHRYQINKTHEKSVKKLKRTVCSSRAYWLTQRLVSIARRVSNTLTCTQQLIEA